MFGLKYSTKDGERLEQLLQGDRMITLPLLAECVTFIIRPKDLSRPLVFQRGGRIHPREMLLERKGRFLEIIASQSQEPLKITADRLHMSRAEASALPFPCPAP